VSPDREFSEAEPLAERRSCLSAAGDACRPVAGTRFPVTRGGQEVVSNSRSRMAIGSFSQMP
jgi:hypothetical protein